MSTKNHLCIICGEEDASKFYNRKSLCKKHHNIVKTPSMKKAILKQYYCVFCGDENEENYHSYCKKKCKTHYNNKIPKGTTIKKKKIITVIRTKSV